ncbi:SDR family oxidoreductase [Nonomuraea africana]|uniref:SDR family oxidoreductase n=1 Tax=Nonomuraea africana TaxID=46171 RepID=UPI0033F408B6
MDILVIGASGAQGGAVARRLADFGHAVRGLTRSGAGLPPGVTPVAGDLADAAAVRAAFDGVTHASVVLPMVFEPSTVDAYVRNIAEAAVAAGVRRLVYNTANRIPPVPTSVAAFETRRAAASLLGASGVPTVVLRPPVYLDNLCAPWVAGPLVHEGVLRYPLPADLPVSWLSHADLANATVAALTLPFPNGSPAGRTAASSSDSTAPTPTQDPQVSPAFTPRAPSLSGPTITSRTDEGPTLGSNGSASPSHPGEGLTLDLGGADVVTGDELAAAFSVALGRPVRYVAQDLDEFEAGLTHALGAPTAAGVVSTYRWIAEHGHDLYDLDPAALEKTLEIRLTPLSTWIAAQPWTELAR